MQIIITCQAATRDEAAKEWTRLHPQARWKGWLGDETGIVELSMDLGEIRRECVVKPMIFTRHIFPVQMELDSPPENHADEIAELLDVSKTYSVQARSHNGPGQARPLSDALAEKGFSLNIKEPEQVVSAFYAKNAVYVGVSAPEDNLSPWNGGMMHFRAEGAVSRAEFKLLEALRTFNPPFAPGGMALDLGAAPGGWTRVLAEDYGMKVTAVDPAELEKTVLAIPNVRHYKGTAGDFLRDNPSARFSIVVNDMKMDARLSLSVMEDLRDNLTDEGFFLATVKLPRLKPGEAAREAVKRIKAANELLFARQLFHNRSEITVCFKPNRNARRP